MVFPDMPRTSHFRDSPQYTYRLIGWTENNVTLARHAVETSPTLGIAAERLTRLFDSRVTRQALKRLFTRRGLGDVRTYVARRYHV
jgi:hypothetical protein